MSEVSGVFYNTLYLISPLSNADQSQSIVSGPPCRSPTPLWPLLLTLVWRVHVSDNRAMLSTASGLH